MASDILVVDDEHDIREIVSGILSDEGHETRTAHDSDSALAAISDRAPRLIFLDIWMQGSKLDGLSLLDEIKTRHPDLPVVISQNAKGASLQTEDFETVSESEGQHIDLVESRLRSNMHVQVPDEHHLLFRSRVCGSRAPHQHRGFLDLPPIEREFGQLRHRNRVRRLLDQLLAKQALGLVPVARLQGCGRLLDDQLGFGERSRTGQRKRTL